MHEDNSGSLTTHTVYLVPVKPKRLICLLITIVPAFMLVFASVIVASDIFGEILVRILAGIFGVYAVFRGFTDYRKPNSKSYFNPNTLRVLGGLLLLALGAMDYRLTPDLQFSHLLFITGGAVIFAGAMFPGLAKKAAISIQNERMEVANVSGNDSILELSAIDDIRFHDRSLQVVMNDGTRHQFSLAGYENGQEAVDEIRQLLKL